MFAWDNDALSLFSRNQLPEDDSYFQITGRNKKVGTVGTLPTSSRRIFRLSISTSLVAEFLFRLRAA